jgi:hypothetical protein
MRSLPLFLSFGLIFLPSINSYGSGYLTSSSKSGYVEAGFGATQFGLVTDYLSEYNIPPSLSMKLLLGKRIARNHNTWFEFSYAYNGAFQTKDSSAESSKVVTYSSQSIAMGLKFTTAPYKRAAAYVRAGGGRLMMDSREEDFTPNTSHLLSNQYESTLTNHFYGGIGANFVLGRKARVGIDVQQMQYKIEETSFADNTVSLTYTRFFK